MFAPCLHKCLVLSSRAFKHTQSDRNHLVHDKKHILRNRTQKLPRLALRNTHRSNPSIIQGRQYRSQIGIDVMLESMLTCTGLHRGDGWLFYDFIMQYAPTKLVTADFGTLNGGRTTSNARIHGRASPANRFTKFLLLTSSTERILVLYPNG